MEEKLLLTIIAGTAVPKLCPTDGSGVGAAIIAGKSRHENGETCHLCSSADFVPVCHPRTHPQPCPKRGRTRASLTTFKQVECLAVGGRIDRIPERAYGVISIEDTQTDPSIRRLAWAGLRAASFAGASIQHSMPHPNQDWNRGARIFRRDRQTDKETDRQAGTATRRMLSQLRKWLLPLYHILFTFSLPPLHSTETQSRRCFRRGMVHFGGGSFGCGSCPHALIQSAARPHFIACRWPGDVRWRWSEGGDVP